MAKPRIFVSSTFYDLKYVREGLNAFIKGMGYDPVLFEKGGVPFQHERALDESCYAEVETCHILVMIIGGRYGSPGSEQDTPIEQIKSVTRKEYERARERDIPIFIFVEKNVMAEHRTYVRNKDKKDFEYAYVDNVEIYKMLDDVLSQKRNNPVKEFDEVETIVSWLRDQWAGLFADFLSKKTEQGRLAGLSEQIASLRDITEVIKNYSAEVVKATTQAESTKIISDQESSLKKRATVRRFSNEPLISFLTGSEKLKISRPSGILNEFEKAPDLRTFLEAIGVHDIEEFIEVHGKIAQADFDEIKGKLAMGAYLQEPKAEADE